MAHFFQPDMIYATLCHTMSRSFHGSNLCFWFLCLPICSCTQPPVSMSSLALAIFGTQASELTAHPSDSVPCCHECLTDVAYLMWQVQDPQLVGDLHAFGLVWDRLYSEVIFCKSSAQHAQLAKHMELNAVCCNRVHLGYPLATAYNPSCAADCFADFVFSTLCIILSLGSDCPIRRACRNKAQEGGKLWPWTISCLLPEAAVEGCVFWAARLTCNSPILFLAALLRIPQIKFELATSMNLHRNVLVWALLHCLSTLLEDFGVLPLKGFGIETIAQPPLDS